jgi:hypothetical protein
LCFKNKTFQGKCKKGSTALTEMFHCYLLLAVSLKLVSLEAFYFYLLNLGYNSPLRSICGVKDEGFLGLAYQPVHVHILEVEEGEFVGTFFKWVEKRYT